MATTTIFDELQGSNQRSDDLNNELIGANQNSTPPATAGSRGMSLSSPSLNSLSVRGSSTRGLSVGGGTSGMALVGKYQGDVQDMQNQGSPYDVPYSAMDSSALMDMLQNDQTNAMIGSLPKKKDTAIKNMPAAGDDSESTVSTGWGKSAVSAGSQVIGETLQALENTAMNDYLADLEYWKAQGKAWFDPNQELKPNLDEYLEMMPSAVETLKGSGMNAIQKGKTDTAGEVAYNVLLNPAAGKSDNAAVSAVLNPLSLFDKKAGDGFAGYVGSQAAKGALSSGMVSGPGAVIGAAVGLVKGIFTWFSAKKEDREREAQVRAEYEKKLKLWTINRNKRILAEQKADAALRQEKRSINEERRRTIQEAKDREKKVDIANQRILLQKALLGAGSASKAYRKERLAKNRR